MSTQDSNTKKIAYGELHFYYPLNLIINIPILRFTKK